MLDFKAGYPLWGGAMFALILLAVALSMAAFAPALSQGAAGAGHGLAPVPRWPGVILIGIGLNIFVDHEFPGG